MTRYILWQFRHMHTFHFEQNAQKQIYCPECGDIYQKRKSLSTNTANPVPTLPKPAKAPVSVLVALSLGLLALGFVFLCVGTILTALPVFLYFAGFDALAAITLAVLSLREKQ